jgi:hypothetical protein
MTCLLKTEEGEKKGTVRDSTFYGAQKDVLALKVPRQCQSVLVKARLRESEALRSDEPKV